MMCVQRQARVGFSLIELMIAITILGILAAIAVPAGLGYLDKAKSQNTEQNMRMIVNGLELYQLDTGKYPTRLKDLVQAPLDEKDRAKWRFGGYLGKNQELPEDGWDNQFQYKVTGPNKYELYSFGRNGRGAPQSEWIRAK